MIDASRRGLLLLKKAFTRRHFLGLTGSALLGILFPWGSKRSKAQDSPAPLDCLEIVSVRPERPHLVAPGSHTTFVAVLTNHSPLPVMATVSVESVTAGWSASVCEADRLFRSVGEEGYMLSFGLAGGERRHFVCSLSPDEGKMEGEIGAAEIASTIESVPSGKVIVRGKVRSLPKIYFVAFDGLGREYIKLDRGGGYEQVDADPLMPNVRQFMTDSACFLNARSQLPSLSDPNHVSLLTGSWPGTTGVICMRHCFCGHDAQGDPVKVPGDSRILRWGSEGTPVHSIFHVAKTPRFGGDRDAFNAMILGKEWIGHYFRDIYRTVDIIAGGLIYPDYLPPPGSYVLGDPQSDLDAGQDRDGVNLQPEDQFRKIPNPPYGTSGENPDQWPDDRWVVEGALRILAAEDPDVLYIQPGLIDLVQHHAGTADRPEEWNQGSHPDILWDDFNRYNKHANRDPVLDVVHEADANFGLVVEALKARESYDESILIFASDHGQRTYMNSYLAFKQICLDAGIPQGAFEWVSSGAEVSFLWLNDRSHTSAIEHALESFTIYHPVFKKEVNPFLVLNRAEMETGVDGVLGRIAAGGGIKRGELYSEWYIDYPVEDNSKILWPDLIVFANHRYQMVYSDPQISRVVGGHGGVGWPQNIPLAIRGPGVRKGLFHQRTVFLVDVVPTLCSLQGWTSPANVDGRILHEVLP